MDLGQLMEPLGKTAEGIVHHLPNLFIFLGILLVGWILARVLETTAVHLIGGLERFVRSRAFSREYLELGLDRAAPAVVGKIVYWITLAFFIVAATESLGLSVMTKLLGGLANYLPNVLAAALIALAGYFASAVARTMISRAASSAGVAHSEPLGQATQVVILLVVGLIVMDQVGIDILFLMVLMAMVLGSLLGALALGFGLGARTMISNMIASYYVSQTYRPGYTVKIGAVTGRILEVTPTAVIVATGEGQVLVPAREFSEKASTLVSGAG